MSNLLRAPILVKYSACSLRLLNRLPGMPARPPLRATLYFPLSRDPRYADS